MQFNAPEPKRMCFVLGKAHRRSAVAPALKTVIDRDVVHEEGSSRVRFALTQPQAANVAAIGSMTYMAWPGVSSPYLRVAAVSLSALTFAVSCDGPPYDSIPWAYPTSMRRSTLETRQR